MKHFFTFLLVATVFFPQHAKADDIFWVELAPYFNYRDQGLSCGGRAGYIGGPLFFMGVVNNAGLVSRAEIRTTDMAYATRLVAFTREDLKGMEVQKDLIGEYWIKTLPLTPHVASWIIYTLIWNVRQGRPSSPFVTLGPSPAVLHFSPKESNVYFAPTIKFHGDRADGSPYESILGFWQKMVLIP